MHKHFIILFQLFAHMGLVYQIIFGTYYEWLVVFGVYFLTGCFGMSVTFHRLLSHNSWKAKRWVKNLGSLCGVYGITGSPIAWAAIHKQHHAHTETPDDPHSPKHMGFLRAQFGSIYSKPQLKLCKDLIKDPFQKFLHRKYVHIHLAIFIGFLILSPQALVYAYLAPAALLWNFGSLVNTLGHKWGYKSHKVKNHSVNNPLLGFLTWGEGWHNNHHRYPNRWQFGEKWYEVDMGSWLIRLIRSS